MSKLLAVLVAIFAAAWFAVPAFADDHPQFPGGYIEICKASTGTPALTGTFAFDVEGVKDPVLVQAGTCSAPIWVPLFAPRSIGPFSFHVTVTEIGRPWFQVAAFDYRDWNGVTVPTATEDLPEYGDPYTFEVPVLLSPAIKDATVLHFTDQAVMGTMEICKYAEDTSGASGTFAFGISSPDHVWGWDDNLPAIPDVNVTIGPDKACSLPIAVPAGMSIVQERPSNGYLYVTGIDVKPAHHMIGFPDIAHGTIAVDVPATIADDGETMVGFTNSMATLKVCKQADFSGHVAWAVSNLGPYSFSATGAAAKFTLDPQPQLDPFKPWIVCNEVARFAAGAPVTVTEDVAAGTAVSNISLNKGPFDEKHGDVVDLAKRTVKFFIRPGVNEVLFTNQLARSVPLKVCKVGVATGTFSFTTAGAAGYDEPFWGIAPHPELIKGKWVDATPIATTFTVRAGQCTDVGYFPFNSTLTIGETAGNLTNVAIDPASTAAVLVSKNLAARNGVVFLGNYDKAWLDAHDFIPAIVDFTNGAGVVPPPATVNPPAGGAPTPVVVTTEPTASVVSTSAPTKVTAPAKVLKVASAKIVKIGKFRYITVRVNGNAKMARIHITLIDKQHKVVSKVTRYVSTNKAVRVNNLRLAPSILSVKVAL